MMSSEMFASEEVISFESSPVEPTHVDHPESHMRYYENVVYIPQVLPPTMVLEYRPVFYNFQTYEPYLINRSQVFYVPFIRQVSCTYLVPYYYRYPVPDVFESSVQNEEDTHYNNYSEISLDDVTSDDLDDINSSTPHSDVTSVLSLPRSDSSNSYEQTEFSSSTQESCDSLQGFVCTEINENLDSMCHDEHNSTQEYLEAYFSDVDADVGIEDHGSNLSLVFVDDEKEPNELDYPADYMHPISFHEDRHEESDDVSNISLSDDTKKLGDLTNSVQVEASSIKNIEKHRNISPERSENHVVIDNDIETCVSRASSLEHVDECLDEYGFENQERSPLKNEIIPNELDCTRNYLPTISFHEDVNEESNISSPSLLTNAEKPGGLTDSPKIEVSSLINIAKGSNISPERRENHTVFDSDMESRVSSSLGYAERCQEENGLEHGQLLSVKNKNVKTSGSLSSPQMPVWGQETPLQNPGSLPKIDAMISDLFDDANNEKVNDSDDDPAISLQDILASEEYWRLRREVYFQKRRNTQLYRSALEGDIRPRRSLPEVGTLATIFEDLPYPINGPYDDGVELDQESVKEEYFDLPPLEVERSKSSHTTLLPKKKRFHNTKKFFSGLFRCLKPR